MHESQHTVTRLLDAVRRGDSDASNLLWQTVYDELRALAHSQMAQEHGPRTLQPTALVNEAYLRLFANSEGNFENRRHFFAAAAQAMHRIRVDDARSRRRLKRGGGAAAVSPQMSEGDTDGPSVFDPDPVDILALDEALSKLTEERPELVELVRLRFFVGLGLNETAEVLGVSRRTVAYKWRLARAWLFGVLGGTDAMADAAEPDGDGKSLGPD